MPPGPPMGVPLVEEASSEAVLASHQSQSGGLNSEALLNGHIIR